MIKKLIKGLGKVSGVGKAIDRQLARRTTVRLKKLVANKYALSVLVVLVLGLAVVAPEQLENLSNVIILIESVLGVI